MNGTPSRRVLLRGLLAGPSLAAACRAPGRPAESGDPAGTGPVTLVTGRDTTGYLRSVLSDWNRAHPTEPAILLELPEVADEMRAQLAGALAERTDRFDVLNLDVVWTAEFAARGWTVALDGAEFPLDRFLPPVLESARYRGRLHAVPYVTNVGLLYYRRDLLDAAGEAAPATWADLRRLARAIAPQHGIGGYAGQFLPYEGLTVNLAEAVFSAGGGFVDEMGRVVLDSPQARGGLEFLEGGLREGWIPQEALSFQEEESRRAFQEGRLLFLRNWPYVYPLAQAADSAVAGRFGAVPLPGPGRQGSGVLGGSNLAVSRYSRRQGTARALIRFLTGRQVQYRVLAEGGLPPVWADLYAEPELVARFPFLPALRRALLTAASRPVVPQYQQLSLAVSETTYEVLLGRRESGVALGRLAGEIRDIIG